MIVTIVIIAVTFLVVVGVLLAVGNRQLPTSLDDIIAPDIVCSRDLRAFFQQHLGGGFRFKVEFQNWLRRNSGMTFRDAVDAYRRITITFES